MGKSNETYNKKEKEKQRLKKRQEKKDKAEERKSNAGKGKSLEDMMAYIDENGNITSTPPDRTKQREVNVDDIVIGIARQTDEPEETVRTGTVTFFNESKGYGFIRDAITKESIFVHASGLTYEARENDKVVYELLQTPKGVNAVKVTKQK